MKRAVIKPEKCKNCEVCLIEINCSKTAVIRESKKDKPWIDFYKCSGCLKCMTYCKNDAVMEISHPCSGKAQKGW
jgi:MinD superfamily P-loop ATPase